MIPRRGFERMLHLWHVTVVVSHTCVHTKLGHQTQSHFWSPHQAILLMAFGVCVLCVIVVSQKLIYLISDHLIKLSYWWHLVCVFFVLLLLAKSWFISFLINSSSYFTDCVWWVCSLCYCCWPKADSVSELLVLLLVCFLVSRLVCGDVWFLVLFFHVNCNGPCTADCSQRKSTLSLCMFQMVVLLDPSDDPDDILRANRSREKQFVFDCTFDGTATQVTCFNWLLQFNVLCSDVSCLTVEFHSLLSALTSARTN